MIISAPAKTNLSIRILKKRDDGYHDIDTLMVPLGLADQLTIDLSGEPNSCVLTCSDATLPTDGSNLVIKAWQVIRSILRIS